MKKLVLPLLFLLPVCVFSQSHSWDGRGIRSDEKIHYLNIFVNIIYDVHPECNDRFQNTQFWPPVSDPALEGINNAAIPTYLLDWMDTVYVPGQLHGSCTRLYGESSFDSLQITGDFIVVNIKESRVLSYGSFDKSNISVVASNMIAENEALTLYGQKRVDDFNGQNVLIRNITLAYGGLNPGSGSGGRNTLQCVGDGNFAANPTNIVTHEISHGLFGHNNFHTSGGNHRYPDGTVMSFLNIQGGYGLMGAANSGLVGCNGYERWRMHWKRPEAVGYIAARNAANTESVVSDISVEDGNKSFLLRDFVTYGDAVRIRLPYKDSETSSNQYIWLENHKVGSNNKLDFLQYSNTTACRPQGAAGVYAYYQVGRDVIEGYYQQVWDNYHRDNLRIISAEGFHDYTKETDTYNLQCVAYDNQSYTLRRGAANPFGGYNDQEMQIVPANEDTVLYVAKELAPWRIVVEGENRDDIPFLGDNHDAFTSYTRLNMGTNPSTCNTRTFHSNNASYSSFISARQPQLNTRTTYLSGLSIELVPVAGTGDFIVNVSWDDYEVTGAVRWTGDVALKDTAVLVQGATVTLAQNMTVAQDRRDPETGLFAGRTRFTVESGAYLRQDSASTLSLTESSSMTVDAGAKYELSLGATLHVGAGCMVAFSPDAVVTLKGTVEVDSGGVLTVYDTVGLGRAARLIIRPGGKLIVDGGTLTSACASEMWQGIEVVGNPTKRQEAKYQGYVDLKNGAVIENAHCAVLTGLQGDNCANSGGIIKAINTTFRNNARSVNMLPYAYILPGGGVRGNIANFSYCTFTNDSENLFAQNDTRFFEHVRLWDVSSVEFYSCNFNNTQTFDYKSGYRAIYAEDAGFIISKGCPDGLVFEECVCPETFTQYNTFTGFNRAIEANTTGNQYEIRIDQSKFSHNDEGIRINGNNFVTITRDSFNLAVGVNAVNIRTGLYLNNCTGYKVEQNSFRGVLSMNMGKTAGILVDNSGLSDNEIYRNTFSTLNYGVMVQGNNGSMRSGLTVACAEFTNVASDIHLAPGATMKTTENVAVNNCISTLCGMWPGPEPSLPIGVFAAMVDAAGNAVPDNTFAANGRMNADVETQNFASLQETYHNAVRGLMGDTIVDLDALRQWHATAGTLAAPNSLTETEFQMGIAEETNAATMANIVETQNFASLQGANDAETANYARFHVMKTALRDNGGNINWHTMSDSQIAELQEIAGRNTGRASEMAKGVLCFFHGICHEDDEVMAPTKSAKMQPKGGYESFFGNNTWEYSVAYIPVLYADEYDDQLLHCVSENYRYTKNDFILINGRKYYSNGVLYIGEDTVTGRLYSYDPNNDKEQVFCDMSLSVDDTFKLVEYLSASNVEEIIMIVDSVYYVNGKKQIRLHFDDYALGQYILPWFYDERLQEEAENPCDESLNFSLRFMEGVGPIYGPKVENWLSLRGFTSLLCLHKDDTLHYMTNAVAGCYQDVVSVAALPVSSFEVYPNPTSGMLNIVLETQITIGGRAVIRDVTGRVVRSLAVLDRQTSVDVSDLTPGLYILTFIDNDSRSVSRKFLKK